MSYIALYRNYRPNSFDEVAGQKHIIRTLKNAVINQKTSHAYVFSGQRGIGKTTIARILAKAVNCLEPINGEPCNKCSNCLSIQNNETPDIVEIDAASNNGVDEMRSLLEKVNYLPGTLNKKVYIIDEAHMLSISAFNALLKTLEEPPVHVMFVLATTEPHKIPSTILSRCQRFDFLQLNNNEIVERLEQICLEENINANEKALFAIAEAAEGGMRDAVNILDQVNSFSEGEITLEDIDSVTGRVSDYKLIELLNAFLAKDAAKSLSIVDELIEMGKEISRLTSNLIQFCRDVLLFKNKVENHNFRNIYNTEEFKSLLSRINTQLIFYYIDVLMDANNKIKYSNSSKIYLEVAIMKIVSTSLDDLLTEKVTNSNNEKVVLQSNMANQELEIKVSELELRVQKIIEQLDGLKLFEFKEATLGKLTLLEEVASTNSTIPQKIEEKINLLETQIASLNISNSVENVSSVSDEFIVRLEALENKENVTVDLTKYDTLFNEVEELKNRKPEVVNNVSVDNNKINELEENIDQLMSYIIDFETNQRSNNFETYSKELSELKENYLVLVNKIVNGDNKGIDFDIDELKETILKEIPTVDYSSDFASINDEITSVKTNNENIRFEINELLNKSESFNNKINEFSLKLETIGNNNFDEKVNDIYKYINDVKEYNFRLNERVVNLQKSLDSVKEEVSKKQTPVVVEKATEPVALEEVKQKPIIVEKEVLNKVVVEEVKPAVEVKAAEEKASVVNNLKEVDETNKIYNVSIIEQLLHDSRSEESRHAKAEIASGWIRLANGSSNTTAPIAKLLRDGMFVAYGNNTILLVYSQASYCNRLMTPKVHKEACDILRITFGREYDFIALPEQTWQEKRKEYHSQYAIGIRFPKLSPINNPELKVVVVKDEAEIKDRTFEKATSIFGFKNVRRED